MTLIPARYLYHPLRLGALSLFGNVTNAHTRTPWELIEDGPYGSGECLPYTLRVHYIFFLCLLFMKIKETGLIGPNDFFFFFCPPTVRCSRKSVGTNVTKRNYISSCLNKRVHTYSAFHLFYPASITPVFLSIAKESRFYRKSFMSIYRRTQRKRVGAFHFEKEKKKTAEWLARAGVDER